MSGKLPKIANLLIYCVFEKGNSRPVLQFGLKLHGDLTAHTPILNRKRVHRELSLCLGKMPTGKALLPEAGDLRKEPSGPKLVRVE